MALQTVAKRPIGRPPVKAAPVLPSRPVSKAVALAPIMTPAAAPLVKRGPGRPPGKPVHTAATALTEMQAKAAPPASASTVDVKALESQISAMKAEIQKQTATIAKLQPRNVRTEEELLSAGELVPADDWRVAGGYAGAEIKITQFTRNKDDSMSVHEGRATLCLCFVPTDDDIGGDGPLNRAQGLLGCISGKRADGTYQGAPFYIYEDELSALWAE